jgi:hypothetical protein
MTDTIFVSFEREDEARAATIVAALRDAGYEVRGDAPDSDDAGRAANETALAQAWLVLVLWSEAAIGRASRPSAALT